MSNWSTEKTKRAPRTKSIQAPKKTQSEITTSESAVKKQECFLQTLFGQSCKASTGSYPASRIAIADHI